MTQFADLGLAAPLLDALATENYTTPTPIQAQAIPYVLDGRDLLGIAQTGTGKTAAFALPILHRLAADRRAATPHSCRVLVLAPTRELASQIQESFETYGRNLRLTSTVVFGGVDMRRQERIMARGVDILVATPGRLVDHMNQRTIRLDRVEVVVLDEVDRMLDIGFIHAIRRVMSHVPSQAAEPVLLGDPAQGHRGPRGRAAQGPGHGQGGAGRHHGRAGRAARGPCRPGGQEGRPGQAAGRPCGDPRHRVHADQAPRRPGDAPPARPAASPPRRSTATSRRTSASGRWAGSRTAAPRVLVATDIAARGIDVDAVSHVVNFDLPDVAETYVHRIGRTARAGAEGLAIALCSADEAQLARHRER